MASLIILIKTNDLEYIDPTRGQYLFGISRVNETLINNETYQYSNRFDGLVPGLYQWAVKNVTSGMIKARGNDIVVNDPSNCFTEFVTSSNNITVLQTKHKLLKVSDIECFYFENNEYFKFLPNDAKTLLNGTVIVTTETPFTGKITIC
jgi:hypothetical protein